MTLEQILNQRYTLVRPLPAFSATHQRYELQGAGGTGGRFVMSFCDYTRPVSAEAIARQRRVGEAMTRPSVALLCRALECRFESEFQFVITEFPGEVSLREVLQERQSLGMDEVEAFLRLLTEACEAAAQAGWPRLTLDTAHLYLDMRVGLPRIPAPDVPAFDAVKGELPGSDPFQTIQFNTADLRVTGDPIPKDTRDCVPALAALVCDLLGQPQSLRGGNARYQPVPQLTSQQNVLLRRALTGEARAGFASAKNFMDEFFGVSLQQDMSAHTGRLRTLTATITRTEARNMPPVSAAAITARMPDEKKPAKPAEPATAPLIVRETDRTAASALIPAQRMRLTPDNEEAPVFSFVADEWLLLGRFPGDADFVAQFRPRSSASDARTRRISRAQARAKAKDARIVIEEKDPLNPSLLRDTALGAHTELDAPAQVLLAGEYPLELHRVKSDYKIPRSVKDAAWWNDAAAPQGAVAARPGGPGVLLWEAALVMSDIGVHFSQSGRPWLRVEEGGPAAARVHHLAGQFWIEAVEPGAIKTAEAATLPAHEMILLREGVKLFIGRYGYKAQEVKVGTGAA